MKERLYCVIHHTGKKRYIRSRFGDRKRRLNILEMKMILGAITTLLLITHHVEALLNPLPVLVNVNYPTILRPRLGNWYK